MAKQRVPPRPGESAEPQPPRSDLPPIDDPAPQPYLEAAEPPGRGVDGQPAREPVRRSASKTRRRMDRYDVIGAVIVGLLVAVWVVHFLLPTPPPDNVPDLNPPSGPPR
jgi:hypothetical protein